MDGGHSTERGESPQDLSFEIEFFEALSRRDPADVRVLEALAQFYTRSGRLSDGLRVDRRIVKHAPDNPIAHYNLACSLALKRRRKEAVAELRRAFECGYDDISWILRDGDLNNLQGYPPFFELLAEMDEKLGRGGPWAD